MMYIRPVLLYILYMRTSSARVGDRAWCLMRYAYSGVSAFMRETLNSCASPYGLQIAALYPARLRPLSAVLHY